MTGMDGEVCLSLGGLVKVPERRISRWGPIDGWVLAARDQGEECFKQKEQHVQRLRVGKSLAL